MVGRGRFDTAGGTHRRRYQTVQDSARRSATVHSRPILDRYGTAPLGAEGERALQCLKRHDPYAVRRRHQPPRRTMASPVKVSRGP
jgi:hypothetical protein